MRLLVRARPNAREEKVEKIGPGQFVVSVTAPPADGRANIAIVKALAKHFGVAPSKVTIVAGYTARTKIVDVALG
jgi:uncharacterized protein (TIGR00251 family)